MQQKKKKNSAPQHKEKLPLEWDCVYSVAVEHAKLAVTVVVYRVP